MKARIELESALDRCTLGLGIDLRTARKRHVQPGKSARLRQTASSKCRRAAAKLPVFRLYRPSAASTLESVGERSRLLEKPARFLVIALSGGAVCPRDQVCKRPAGIGGGGGHDGGLCGSVRVHATLEKKGGPKPASSKAMRAGLEVDLNVGEQVATTKVPRRRKGVAVPEHARRVVVHDGRRHLVGDVVDAQSRLDLLRDLVGTPRSM